MKKAAQGGGRAEGNADADRRQEAGEGGRGEKAGGQAAAEVGLGVVKHPVTPDGTPSSSVAGSGEWQIRLNEVTRDHLVAV